jgi:hypothetical protein
MANLIHLNFTNLLQAYQIQNQIPNPKKKKKKNPIDLGSPKQQLAKPVLLSPHPNCCSAAATVPTAQAATLRLHRSRCRCTHEPSSTTAPSLLIAAPVPLPAQNHDAAFNPCYHKLLALPVLQQ